MNIRILALGLASLGLLSTQVLAAQGATLPDRIPLVVSDQIGATRAGEVVCSGVPFAKGALKPEQPLHVQTRDGKALATQTKVLGVWPDGSGKWLLVQFVANCAANSRREYELVLGPPPAPKTPLTIKDEGDRLAVDTGALKVTVPKSKLTTLGNVRLQTGGRTCRVLASDSPMRFVLADGTVHTTAGSKPESVTVEENGPLRATIHVVGWLLGPEQERSYKLDARLRFYAGQSYVRGDYTFICLGQPALHHVREIAVVLAPIVGGAPSYVLPGTDPPAPRTLASGQTAVLSVDARMVCRLDVEGIESKAENPLAGWGLLAGRDAAVGVAVRNFRQLCPKAIELAPDRIKLALWSGRSGEVLNLGRTRAKTHRILFEFAVPQSGQRARLDRLRAFQEPLIATVDPAYFCSTDALGPLSPAGAAETAKYDQMVGQAFAGLRRQRQTMPRENGMLHYGDYYHGGYGNKVTRGDLEYDTGHACFLLYARSGERQYYDFAVACNQHFIDVDVNQETGDQRFHGYGQTAETHEAVTTSLEWGHVFTDCPADAYYFTGDERSLQAVRMIADRVATIADGQGDEKIRNIFAGAERQLGWPLSALCRAYEVTRDKKYLDAAAKVVDYIKRYAKDPVQAYTEGTWWRSWMMDGCKVFMTGQLHDGLAAYYEQTGDQELRDVIIKSLDWLIDHMWNPQVDGFMYEFNAMNRKHRQGDLIGLNLLIADAYRVGYEISGDPRYLAVSTRAFWSRVQEMTLEQDGKQFSQDTRSSPHAAAYFYREHIRPENLPPSPRPRMPQSVPAPAGNAAQDSGSRIRANSGRSEDSRSLPKSGDGQNSESSPQNDRSRHWPTGPRPEILLRAGFEGELTCETPAGTQQGHAVNEIEFVAGKHGQAVAVGKHGYVWLPAPPDMLRFPGSIELWVKLHFKKNAGQPGQRAVFHVEGQNPLIDSLAACTIYGELRIRMKNHIGHLAGTAAGAIAAWAPGQWHHVVVTWDEERVRLYLDGQQQTRPDEGRYLGDTVTELPAGEQTKINLGWRFGNWYCDCAIDDLTIYGKALTAGEVSAKFAQH